MNIHLTTSVTNDFQRSAGGGQGSWVSGFLGLVGALPLGLFVDLLLGLLLGLLMGGAELGEFGFEV